MRCCTWIALIAVGLAAGVSACDGKTPLMPAGAAGTGGAGTGAAGVGAAGTGTAGTGAAGTGATGVAGTGAAGMGAAGTGVAGAGGADAGASDAGALGPLPTADVTKVVPTAGCGQAPGQALGTFVEGTIQTMGTKPDTAADSKKGDWSYQRQYFVKLPVSYDATRPLPLIFEGPGCGGTGKTLYSLTPELNTSVIRVGLTPPPNDIGHATSPNQFCFDDKEGDDSVDWVFYERLYDKLAAQLCFDRNRVFVLGGASGANFANELGCKYAGDATRPIRATMTFTGGLPTDPRFRPTCSTKPVAGFWAHAVNDQTHPFEGTKVAVARAMQVNGCTMGTGIDDAPFDPFWAVPSLMGTCRVIKGCPPLHPLIYCPLPMPDHGSGQSLMDPGVPAFVKMFSTAPLLIP